MRSSRLLAVALGGCLLATAAFAASQEEAEEAPEEPPVFTDAFLQDQANIDIGKEVWVDQCQHCHGKNAYPGKAPKLKPRRYTADFVFDRVTNGFRKMPGWKDAYTKEERMGVTAWILSSKFSP